MTKKFFSFITVMIFTLTVLTACAVENTNPHQFVFEKQEAVTLTINEEEIACVGIYGTYTNNSDESACVADWVSVKAFQNGVELSPIVPSDERTNDYLQCDKYIQPTQSEKVIFLFTLQDSSEVTIEIDGQKIEP